MNDFSPDPDHIVSDGKDKDYLSVEMRLALIRQSIVETAINHSSDRFTIYRSINRAIFAFNEPIVFAFLQKRGRNFWIVSATLRDPMTKDAFSRALDTLGFMDDRIGGTRADELEKIPVKIFDTNFYLLPFSVSYPNRREAFKQSNLVFDPFEPDSTVHTFLARAFKRFGRSLATLRLGRDFQDHIKNLFERSTPVPAQFDNPDAYPAPNTLGLLLSVASPIGGQRQSVIEKLDEMLLKEILRISDSLLLSAPSAPAPNLMVFSKRFTRSSRRFGHYFYDATPFLPPALVKRYVDQLEARGQEGLVPFPDEAACEWFQEALRTRAINEISQIAMSPLSAGVRLFVDYVMRTGTGLVYLNPFKDGYLGWLREGLEDEERIRETRRLAILHYFLQADDTDAKTPTFSSFRSGCPGRFTWLPRQS